MTIAEQTIVMTGASRGIGRIAAEHLLKARARTHLVLLARGETRSLEDELRATGGTVSTVQADLSDLHSVAEAAAAMAARLDAGELPPVRALVCNAGVQHTNALAETADGFEATFAVNVLAHHVLLRGLRDHLQPGARVVITVSDTHFGDLRHNLAMVPSPKWQPPETLARVGAFPRPGSTTAGRAAYSTSKLAAIYLVHEYARRFPTGPTYVGYNPGLVPGTGLARDAGALSRFAMRRIMPLLTHTPLATSPREAGRHLAGAALGKLPAPSGSYIDRDHVARSSAESYDRNREVQTWGAVEALTAQSLAPSPPAPRSGEADAHHHHHRGQ